MTNQEEREFQEWFAAKDLGELEDVRYFVELQSRQNACDVEASEELKVVKSTVEYYLDSDPSDFDYYR